jgi:hypothetical protein
MAILIINKIPLLKMFRRFFTLEFGIVDYDDALDCLCSGINGSARDQTHIRDMVYGDAWYQGHHEPYTDEQKARLFRFLLDVRGKIVWEIHQTGRTPYHLHFRYLIKHTTSMSLKFEVYE